MLDQPWPIPMSTTRAGGSPSSRAWTSAIAGSQTWPSRDRYIGRLPAGLALAQVVTEGFEAEPAAGPEHVDDGRQLLLDRPEHGDRGRGRVGERVTVEERLAMAGRQLEATRFRVVGAVGVEDRRDGALLEPLPDVAPVETGPRRDLRRGRRPQRGECGEQPEALAEVDVEQVERADRVRGDPFGERVAPVRFGGGKPRGRGHG